MTPSFPATENQGSAADDQGRDYERSVAVAQVIVQAADDQLASHPVVLDMREHTPFTDLFVIASAPTDRQVRAIAEHIEENLAQQGRKPLRQEGYREGSWVLLDYGDVVAHIQLEETREFYALERLWHDSPRLRG